MWKQLAIAGSVGAAILGTGAGALAVSGTTGSVSGALASTPVASSTASTSSGSSGSAATGKGALKGLRGNKLIKALGRLEHGEWVTQGKSGDVTHDAITGTVSAVSPTSITVKAKDGFTETFTVNTDTAVRVKGTGKAAIADVKVADRVLVAGVKDGTALTANHVLDGGS